MTAAGRTAFFTPPNEGPMHQPGHRLAPADSLAGFSPPGGFQVHAPAAVLVDPQGDPVPPPHVVETVAKRWPHLQIAWVRGGPFSPAYFGLKQRWRADDRRWERVRTGELPEHMAFDLLTTFPRDCTTDGMIGWIANHYGERAIPKDPRKEAERLIAEAQRLMASAEEQNIEDTILRHEGNMAEESSHTLRLKAQDGKETVHAMVYGTEMRDSPKRLLPKPEPVKLHSEAKG